MVAAEREIAARSMAKGSLSPPPSPDWICKQPQGGDKVMATGRRVSEAQEGLPYMLRASPQCYQLDTFPQSISRKQRENRESFGVPCQGIKWNASLSMEM